jgi:Rad3-related DNA helicase
MDAIQKMKVIRQLRVIGHVHKDFAGFTKFEKDEYGRWQDNLESFGILCLNPSYIFKKLIAEERPRSVILTSGTLNPLSILKKELDT